MVKVIETKDEFDKLINDNAGKKLVVVDFYADWCGPCRQIAPTFQKLAENFKDVVVFVKVNVDENEETAEAMGVSAMPTFILFKDGNKVDEIVGANEKALEEKIEKYK